MTSYLIAFDTAIGKIGIVGANGLISRLYLPADSVPQDGYKLQETDLLVRAAVQLQEYLAGERATFDLPLSPAGTDFMHVVWDALCTIPYAETRTYGEIAKAVGSPQAARAVGLANHNNPIPIFIPCHRVIGARGKLVGYRGGLALKAYLLQLERRSISLIK
ncbi:MAG: methylated-DNA--[protein]-cysteine S-methyltransferase [Chloroflexi bacterium]|nr:methylated-DNA--[protein]-cysteine S-methyltransferase [Chloroflexota bacterium]